MFGPERLDLTAEVRRGLPGSFVELPAGVTHYELRGEADVGTVVLIHGNAAPSVTSDRTIGRCETRGSACSATTSSAATRTGPT